MLSPGEATSVPEESIEVGSVLTFGSDLSLPEPFPPDEPEELLLEELDEEDEEVEELDPEEEVSPLPELVCVSEEEDELEDESELVVFAEEVPTVISPLSLME